MADLLKFKHGLHANMKDNSPAIAAGTVYITRDERAMYVDLPPYEKDGVVEPAKRIRIGDMRTYEHFEDLTNDLATDRSSLIQSALYFVEKKKVDGKDVVINALFKWNGSQFVQLNSTSDLVAELSDLEGRVTTVEGQVAAHATRIGANETAITGIKSRLDTVESTRATKNELSEAVAEIEGKLDTKATKTDLQALTNTVAANKAAAETAVSGVSKSLTEEVNRAKGIESGLRTDVDANTQNIGINTAAIATLNGDASTTGSVDKKVKDAVDAEATARAQAITTVNNTIADINTTINDIKAKNDDQDIDIAGKVAIAQGTANEGKLMYVNAQGNVVPTTAAVASKLTHLSNVTGDIQAQINEVNGRVDDSNGAIAGLTTRMGVAEGAIASNDTDIAALQKAISDLGGSGSGSIQEQIKAAVEAEAALRVAADADHDAALLEHAGDIEDLSKDLAALTTKHNNFEASVESIYESKNHASSTYETKANASSTYATKTELATEKSNLIGKSTDAASADTIYGAKAAAKAASDAAAIAQTQANSGVNKANTAQQTIDNYISSNNAALAGVKATADAAATKTALDSEIARAKAAEEANTKAIAAEATRAKNVEADFESRIATMEVFWDTTEDSDNVVNKLKEIQDYIASDESGAATMAGNIQANANAISGLDGRLDTAESEIDALQSGLAAEITRAKAAEAAALDAANAYTNGLLDWGTF